MRFGAICATRNDVGVESGATGDTVCSVIIREASTSEATFEQRPE